MKLRLTKEEMLAQWMLRRHLEPVRADCVVARSDAIDLEAYCAMEMRGWYLNLLATAPADLLAPRDIASECDIEAGADGYSVEVWLPDRVVRPLTARLAGWRRSARVEDEASPSAARCACRFSAGGIAEPVAIAGPGGRLRLYSRPSTRRAPVLESLEAVVDEGEEFYCLDERALALITPY